MSRFLGQNDSALKAIPLLNDVAAWNGSTDRKLTKRAADTETLTRLPSHIAGSNAYVFQSVHELTSGNVVNDNLLQLMQMVRTLKVHGAKNVTAVMPYHAYARQDKPSFMMREATLAKLTADLLIASGVDNVMTYHPHSECLGGFYEPHARFTGLNGLDLFIGIAESFKGLEDVSCVSTDAGGAKFALHFARALDVDYAIANKYKPSDRKAEMLGIIGNLEGKRIALIGDDETVTVTSLSNAAKELHGQYGIQEIHFLISHNKVRPEYVHRLQEAHDQFGLRTMHVTDTVPQLPAMLELPFVTVHSLAERFARTINRLHYNQSTSELFYRPKD